MWTRPPLHLAPSVQPRAWECRLPNHSEAHCAAACWTQVPQPAGPHNSPPGPLRPVPLHAHTHALLCSLQNLLHVTGTTVFKAESAAPPRPTPTTSLPV